MLIWRRVHSALKFTTALVLVLSLSLHWALLQTVAWTGMVVTYSRDASLSKALSMTFDGKHPCCMCKMIQKAREKERKQDQQQVKPDFRLDVGLVWQSLDFHFAHEPERIPHHVFCLSPRSEQPPKPPPRNISSAPLA